MRFVNDFDALVDRKKKRLRTVGKTLDESLRYMEKNFICPIYGTNDLIDTAEMLYVCSKCFRKFKSYDGVRAIPIMALGIGDDLECAFCGRKLVYDTMRGENSWYILEMPISIKAMWKKLGKKKRPLKIFGERLW